MKWDMLVGVLSYAGFLVTSVSAVWALFHDATARDDAGRKVLTRAGYVTLGLICVGFAVGVGSKFIGAQMEARNAAERRASERLQALRLAASSQPLQSLQVRWRFIDVSEEARARLDERSRELESDLELDDDHKFLSNADHAAWIEDMEMARIGCAWWGLLATGNWENAPDVLVRLPLYDSEAVVLPLGCMHLPSEGPDDESRRQRLGVGAGVACYEDANRDPAGDPPCDVRKRRAHFMQEFALEDHTLSLETNLETGSLPEAIDAAAAGITPLSQLPTKVEVSVMTGLSKVSPWPIDNMSGRLRRYAVTAERPRKVPFEHLKLLLVPNGVAELGQEFDLVEMRRGTIVRAPGLEVDPDPVGEIAILTFQRTG